MAACYTADSILTERKLTRMKSNSFFRTIALLAAIALAVPAFAKPLTKTINIAQNAKLGKSELKAGEYRLQIEGSKATVQKGKAVVAESEGRWEDRSTKAAYDSVLISESGQVKEVRFAGQTRVFVFNE
jgi:predicted membrane-bound mannosyltransferase